MNTIDDRLTLWEGRIGPGFGASITPTGSLRLWMVKHLIDQTGESAATVEAAIDGWLERASDVAGSSEASPLDDHIKMLLEQRRQIDSIKGPVEAAYLDGELGAALCDVGRPFEALSRFMAARETFERHDMWLDAGVCDMEMGIVTTDLGWHSEAHSSFLRARPMIGRHGTVGDFSRLLVGQASLAKASDLTEDSVDLLQKARWLAFEAGEFRTFAIATHNLANNASSDAEFAIASNLFGEARKMYLDIGDDVAVADCDKNAASMLIESGEYSKGLALAREALDVYLEHGQPIESAHARRTIAHALDHLGEYDAAAADLQEAKEAFNNADRLPLVAGCEIDLSYTLRSLGRFDDASDAVIRARDIYREIGKDADDKWFAETLKAIALREIDTHRHP
jgi:tetratricopeptide (TPR) repeat protein